MNTYDLTDVIRFIFDVERGAVRLTPLPDKWAREGFFKETDGNLSEYPRWLYAGNVVYQASNGWQIVVFNDCNEFDYIDSIVDPSGYTWKCEDVSFFFQYSPPEEVVRDIYYIW